MLGYVIAAVVVVLWVAVILVAYRFGSRRSFVKVETAAAGEVRTAVDDLAASIKDVFDDAERKRAELVKAIERMEAQRNEWRELYQQHAIEHGNAQAMLFNEVQRVTALASRAGVNIAIDPTVRRVVCDYFEAHVEPSRAARPDVRSVTPTGLKEDGCST